MARLVRIAVVALALVGILSGVGGTRHAAAGNGYEQWVVSDDGRCLEFWNGYDYVLAGCLRADGYGVDAYYKNGGQWVYLFSAGPLSDGGSWLYYQGIYYYDTVGNSYANNIYPTTATVGAPTWEGLTNNPVANSFILSMQAGAGVWTAPDCIYNLTGICVY